MKFQHLRPALGQLASHSSTRTVGHQIRCLHKTRPSPSIPQPRPFVPDVQTFLTLIGRGLSKHSSKFPSWEGLFSLTGHELKELGIEPPRSRKYLVQWMQKYRKGVFGPGGDFKFVKDGEAILKVATPPAAVANDAKYVVNVPHADQAAPESVDEVVRPNGYTVHGLRSITGPHAVPLAHHGGAVVKVTEGMWEDKRGRKIDGGERRRAETRFKKRSAERRAEREAELLKSL